MSDRLLMYDSLGCSFLCIKKPPKQSKCPVCGPTPTIRSMEDSAAASANARGPSCTAAAAAATDLPPELDVSCREYDELREKGHPHVLLDVRVAEQFALCSLEGGVNVPLARLSESIGVVEQLSGGTLPVYCMCRRGVASAAAVKILSEVAARDRPSGTSRIHSVKNIRGGLDSWRRQVDRHFPSY